MEAQFGAHRLTVSTLINGKELPEKPIAVQTVDLGEVPDEKYTIRVQVDGPDSIFITVIVDHPQNSQTPSSDRVHPHGVGNHITEEHAFLHPDGGRIEVYIVEETEIRFFFHYKAQYKRCCHQPPLNKLLAHL